MNRIEMPTAIREATRVGMGAPFGPVESIALGAFSQSTGSVLLDAAVGGGVAYWLAPEGAKTRYAVGGALATGLGGALGLLATVGFIWATSRDRQTNPIRRRSRRRR